MSSKTPHRESDVEDSSPLEAQFSSPGPSEEAPAQALPLAGGTRAALGPAPRREAGPDPLAEFFFKASESDEHSEDGQEQGQSEPEEAPEEYLGFKLGAEDYALPLHRILEIVKVPPITEVPRAPLEIAGVMSLRGEVMPVYDLRRRLGLAPAESLARTARVVVVDVGEGPVGVIVDAVAEVLRFKPSSIEAPPPGLGAGVDSEYLAGIGRQKDHLYIVLNLAAVLGDPKASRRERA